MYSPGDLISDDYGNYIGIVESIEVVQLMNEYPRISMLIIQDKVLLPSIAVDFRKDEDYDEVYDPDEMEEADYAKSG